MNKLEELHVKPFDVINPFSPYDINRDCQRAKDNDLMAKKSAEITTDVAIRFTEWCDNNCNFKYKEFKWVIGDLRFQGKLFTIQELFEEFINNHY
jgi:hypothetical protein